MSDNTVKMAAQHPDVARRIGEVLTNFGDQLLEMAAEISTDMNEVCGIIQWDDVVVPNTIRMVIFDQVSQEVALGKLGSDDSGFAESLRRLWESRHEGLLRVLLVMRSGHVLVTRVGNKSQWTALSKGGSA